MTEIEDVIEPEIVDAILPHQALVSRDARRRGDNLTQGGGLPDRSIRVHGRKTIGSTGRNEGRVQLGRAGRLSNWLSGENQVWKPGGGGNVLLTADRSAPVPAFTIIHLG